MSVILFVACAMFSAGFDVGGSASARLLLGLSPEGLVVAGAEVTDPALIAVRLAESNDAVDDLLALDAAIVEAMESIREHEAALLADPEEDEAPLLALIVDRDELIDERNAAVDALFAFVVADLPPAVVARLGFWRQAAAVRVPAHFRAVDRTPVQWRVIERAHRRCLSAEVQETDPDPEDLAVVTAIEGEADVIAAHARMSTLLDAMKEAFETHLGEAAPGGS